MVTTRSFRCPLCGSADFRTTGSLHFECPEHGRFILSGDAEARPGLVVLHLEHWNTGLTYEAGECTPDEWVELSKAGR